MTGCKNRPGECRNCPLGCDADPLVINFDFNELVSEYCSPSPTSSPSPLPTSHSAFPTRSPSPSISQSVSPSISASSTAVPSISQTPDPSTIIFPSRSASPSVTKSKSITPSKSPPGVTASRSVLPSRSSSRSRIPTFSATPFPSPSTSRIPGLSGSVSSVPSRSRSPTPLPSASGPPPSVSPTSSMRASPTFTMIPSVSSTPSASTLPSSTPSAIPRINIPAGVFGALTGKYQVDEAGIVDATICAMNEINRQGGIRINTPAPAQIFFDPLVYDTQSVTANALTGVVNAINAGAKVLFGFGSSAVRKTVHPVVITNQNLLIYPKSFEGAEAGTISANRMLHVGGDIAQTIKPAIDWAIGQNKNKFFLMGSETVDSRTVNTWIRNYVNGLGLANVQIIGEAYIPTGLTGSALNSAIANLADSIRDTTPASCTNCFMGVNTVYGYDDNSVLYLALAARGVRGNTKPIMNFRMGEEQIKNATVYSNFANHLLVGNYFAELINTVENTAFLNLMRSDASCQVYQRQLPGGFNPLAITDTMANAYMSVKLWAAAVRSAQSAEPTAVAGTLPGVSVVGPSGTLSPDNTGSISFRDVIVASVSGSTGNLTGLYTGYSLQRNAYPAPMTASTFTSYQVSLYSAYGNRWEN